MNVCIHICKSTLIYIYMNIQVYCSLRVPQSSFSCIESVSCIILVISLHLTKVKDYFASSKIYIF